MKRKFSDYVLLVLSIFALIYGSLSLFSIAYSFIQGCLDNEFGELFFYSQLPELINLIPTVISLFQGVRLLICFVKKTSDKKANAIISIAYSFAVGILFSFMTNMILTLAFSNGNFGDFLKKSNTFLGNRGLYCLLINVEQYFLYFYLFPEEKICTASHLVDSDGHILGLFRNSKFHCPVARKFKRTIRLCD